MSQGSPHRIHMRSIFLPPLNGRRHSPPTAFACTPRVPASGASPCGDTRIEKPAVVRSPFPANDGRVFQRTTSGREPVVALSPAKSVTGPALMTCFAEGPRRGPGTIFGVGPDRRPHRSPQSGRGRALWEPVGGRGGSCRPGQEKPCATAHRSYSGLGNTVVMCPLERTREDGMVSGY